MYHHSMMGFRDKVTDYRTCIARQSMSFKLLRNIGVCSLGQSVMLFQHVAPLPSTRRFVRLLLIDAGRGVQSVRPTHLGFHQVVCVVVGRNAGFEGSLVPEGATLAFVSRNAKYVWKCVGIRVSLETVSTLCIQVEECLSVSQYHHTAVAQEGRRGSYLSYDKQ
jgi:hypothetical protein